MYVYIVFILLICHICEIVSFGFDDYFLVIYCVIDSIFALICKFLFKPLIICDVYICRFLIFRYTILSG